MEYVNAIIEKEGDRDRIREILDGSLTERDFFGVESRRILAGMGLGRKDSLMLLAHHKSRAKYGYALQGSSLEHLLDLGTKEKPGSPLHRLIESPFFLVKTCWLYEHAPYFFFYSEPRGESLDSLIRKFAEEYDAQLFQPGAPAGEWKRRPEQKHVTGVSFWDTQFIDPVRQVERAWRENLEGIEISFDFHPFNYRRLLPEELSGEKREELKEAARKGGIRLDIHSPIVGPYAPSPDPRVGRQLFFDPMACIGLQREIIQLAKDIGAEAVVFHLVDTSNLQAMADLISEAGGSSVRVTVENYCQTAGPQNADSFIACLQEIYNRLPEEVRRGNFGVTMDVGHLNIEGDDPLLAAEKIGRWCLDREVYLRVHATDNYGKLLFSPPAYSADVHGNVAGRGINNPLIIKLLRSMGLRFHVVAEQIQPLTPEDVAAIHGAQTAPIEEPYEMYVLKGRERISKALSEPLLSAEVANENAFLFLAGMEGIAGLKEHLVYRKIQDKKYLSVEEAKRISQQFMRMPEKFKNDLIDYMDDLLLPIQGEQGVLQKSELDFICHNISGALFGTINNEHLNRIFSETRKYVEGEIICEQDSLGQEMFFIKEGAVDVLINSSNLASLGPGEIFGEISLFYNVRRTATIRAAAKETRVGVLSREGFESLLLGSEPYAYDLISRLYHTLPDRLRNLNDKYRRAIDALHIIMGDDQKVPKDRNMRMEFEPKGELFPSLSVEEAGSIFKEVRFMDEDQIVFAEGDRGDGAYLVLEGTLKVVTFSDEYEEIVLGELGPDEIFGEMALIDNKPRSASIVTTAPCKVAFVDRASFDQYIETRTDLAFRLMAFICLSLFKRILTLDKIYGELKRSFL
ncbi:MAG: cyclic nucleotide-binding domain-containing protein [Deltaproteobacteria bacterium]|nr:cyclic nucleotide-binding domain-containing protein [Deltaproteobacteria bacterium]